jgi:ribosome maturation factor RimP
VSSPGLDRALATEDDFRRFHGALAKVGLLGEDGKLSRRMGRLSTREAPWRLLTEDGEIPFDASMVKSAKLVPEI